MTQTDSIQNCHLKAFDLLPIAPSLGRMPSTLQQKNLLPTRPRWEQDRVSGDSSGSVKANSSAELIEVDIDGRTFWVRPVGAWVLQSNNLVAEAMAISLDKPLEWAVGFFFGNTELSLELWTVIAGISGFDD